MLGQQSYIINTVSSAPTPLPNNRRYPYIATQIIVARLENMLDFIKKEEDLK